MLSQATSPKRDALPEETNSQSQQLVESFAEFFEVVPAISSSLLETVYRIRYSVYAEELGWEDTDQFPSGQEKDRFDTHSRHCLLRHRPSGNFIGCVRIVLPDAQNPTKLLPIENSFNTDLISSHPLCRLLKRNRVTEISRIAVLSSFRHRPGEKTQPNTDIEEPRVGAGDERRRFPHIALGLYLAAAAMGISEGMEGALAMMEPKLARRLRIFGITFQQLADPIEHRGSRAPYLVSHENFSGELAPPMAALLTHIHNSLNR